MKHRTIILHGLKLKIIVPPTEKEAERTVEKRIKELRKRSK